MEKCTILKIEGRYIYYICPNGHINYKRKDYLKNTKNICKECKIYDLHILFKSFNYKLLESRYKGMHTKVKYKCNKGHYNYIIPSCFKSGDRCPDCAGVKKINFNIIKQKFKELNYILLSNENDYKNSNSKLKYICNKNHQTITTWSSIRSGRKCKECFSNKLLTIKYIKDETIKFEYTVLSEEYENSLKKLKMRCPDGHEIYLSWNKFQSGRRCKSCKNKSENMCRKVFEKKFKYKFPNCRPSWLNGLELDGYCKELNIAFEYNGIQHYEYVPFFHSGGSRTLEKQLKRDKLKKELCIKNNIKLYIIPYHKLSEIEEYLEKLLNSQVKTSKLKKLYKFQGDTKKLIKTYDSIEIAAKEENISPSTMRRISLNNILYKGYIYSRNNILSEVNELKKASTKKIKIKKLDPLSNISIKEYNSLSELVNELKIPSATIRYKIKNQKLIDGYLYQKI